MDVTSDHNIFNVTPIFLVLNLFRWMRLPTDFSLMPHKLCVKSPYYLHLSPASRTRLACSLCPTRRTPTMQLFTCNFIIFDKLICRCELERDLDRCELEHDLAGVSAPVFIDTCSRSSILLVFN